jgi:HSP20 family protein
MAEKRAETRTEERGLERSSGRSRGLSPRRDPFDVFSYGPFAMLRRMQDDMDRIFGGFGGGLSRFSEREGFDWMPAIDAFQRGNEFVIRADVPGLSRDDLSVEVGEDALTIRGERKHDREEEHEGVFRRERSYGTFYRVVPLPEGAVADSAKATFKDGVLEVVLQAPPQEVSRGRKIDITEERGASDANREKSR